MHLIEVLSKETASILTRTTEHAAILQKHDQAPRFRPATPAGIDGVPTPEAFGQATPFATLLGNVKNGVQDLKVRKADVATLTRQTVFDQAILRFGNLHAVSISHQHASVNRP